jgi:hypothetical protein
MGSVRGAQTMYPAPPPPDSFDSAPGVLDIFTDNSIGHGLKSGLVRMLSLPLGVPWQPSVDRP